MGSNFKKMPPVLSKCSSYEDYKKLLELWTKFTSLAKTEQGTAVLLSLEGKAQEAVLELSSDDISSETGVENIINRLDRIYLQDTLIKKYEALDNFENYKRPPDVSVSSYILEFDKRYLKTKNLGTQISDDLLAYRLLRNANLGDQYTKLVKATAKLEYDSMKQQLKNLFSEAFSSTSGCVAEPLVSAGMSIKEESDTFVTDSSSEHDVMYSSVKKQWRSDNVGTSGPSRHWSKKKSFKPSQQNSPSNQKDSSSSAVPKGKNPLKSDGARTRCFHCESINHHIQNCPDLVGERSSEDTLFNNEVILCEGSLDTTLVSDLVAESLNCALLDSGASKNVCGRLWLNSYVDSLPESDKLKLKRESSSSIFRFGDGNKVESSEFVTIPATLGSQDIIISTDVIDKDIPLLLSKKAMKDVGMNLNFERDTVTVFGEDIKLRCTTSGHYSLPLTSSCQALDHGKPLSENILSCTNLDDKIAVAKKLHRQFAHPPVKRLLKLLDVSGDPWKSDDNLKEALRVVSDSCETCRNFKKPPPRPCVGLPLATTFLECVGMDLKKYDSHWLLHCVDHATRLSMSVRIPSKDPRVILTALFKHFISIWGTVGKFLSDNGGEFANSQFMEMCEKLNIRFILTAGQSPFSNGLVERHNLVLGDMLDKVLDDIDCGIDIAIAWCVNAKNSLQNIHGFSPYQLAIGKNPTFPIAIDSYPPALTQFSENDIIRKNLEALHKSREAFVRSESSERISRALSHNVRAHNDVKYYTGDTVYFKRVDEKKWRGPAKVLGQDGQQVLLKYGGYYTRSHPCRVVLSEKHRDVPLNVDAHVSSNENMNTSNSNDVGSDSSDEEEFSSPYANSSVNANRIIPADTSADSTSPPLICEPASADNEPNHGASKDITEQTNTPKLKSGMSVKVLLRNSQEWSEVKLTSRSGKAGRGKYPNSWNTVNDSGVSKSIDFDRDVVSWESVVHHPTDDIDEILVSDDVVNNNAKIIAEAKMTELATWKSEGVYDEVCDEGQPCISVRWVISEKEGASKETITKARLCARGFEEMQDFRTDSPTCKRESIRLVLSFIAANKWELNSIDIKRAFLQSNEIEREVFIRPPDEACTDKIWCLKKCVYGLADAPRSWYITFSQSLMELGCSVSNYDPGVFLFFSDGKLQGIIACFVDDVIWGGFATFRRMVVCKLHEIFKVGSTQQRAFPFLGVSLRQEEDMSILIDQNSYAATLKPIPVSTARLQDKSGKISSVEEKQLRSLVGQLNWLSGISRPEISFDVSLMSSKIRNATVDDLLTCNKLLKQVQSNPTFIKFPVMDVESLSFVVHCDSSWNNLPNGGSQGAFIILLKDNNNLVAPVEWSSTKIRRVARSTVTAETLAMLDACDAAFLLSRIVLEILQAPSVVIDVMTDNKSLFDNIYSSKVTTEKRLVVDMCAIREMANKKEVIIHKIASNKNLSNVLTKKGAPWQVLTNTLQRAKLM